MTKTMNIRRWLDLGILIYLVLGVCAYFFLFTPQRAEVNRLKAQKEGRENLYVQLKSSTQFMDQFQAKEDEISEAIARFQGNLIAKDQTQLVLVHLGKICERSGVRLQSITPLPSEKIPGNLERFSWEIPLKAGYHNLGAFLNKLESCPTFFGIDNLSISSGTYEHEAALALYTVGLVK